MKTPTWGDRFWRSLFGWQSWPLPAQEKLDLETARDHSVVGSGDEIVWPWPGHRVRVRDTSSPPRNGITPGIPMQAGAAVEQGFVWGGAEQGERFRTRLPLPELGAYWPQGYPAGTSDSHLIVQAVDGAVHELFMFTPAGARGWGLWLDGQLVGGRAATATGLALHPRVWTPWSAARPHVCAMVVPDYDGADGSLGGGPRAGERVVLDNASQGYAAMRREGGACAALAIALSSCGAEIVDRSGYADAAMGQVGSKPHPASIHVQSGALWAHSNIDRFAVTVTDFRRALPPAEEDR